MIDRNLFRKTESILYRYNDLTLEIKSLELEIKSVENEYIGCGSISYEDRGTPTNAFNSSVENEVINKEKMIQKLNVTLYNKKILKEKIDSTVDTLNDSERSLVELRYMNRNKLSWDQIGYVLKFSPDYCRQKLRSRVINRIGNTIFINPYKQLKLEI